MDLQSEYNSAPPSGGAPDSSGQPQAHDVTIPAAAAAQIMQAIQQNDCQGVCKMMGDLLSGGSQDSDSDGSQ